jgi:hypothetical protein
MYCQTVLRREGGPLTHKHFQIVVNKKIKVCLGWDVNLVMGQGISCNKLRDKGLHTFLSMVRYCMKDNGEEYFEGRLTP